MAKENVINKVNQESLRFVRWVLFLIVAAESAGIERVSRRRLHSLLFMSFASSRYYEIRPLRLRAQRTEQGPYYRAAHIALGTLTLSGLIDIENFDAYVSHKHLQFEAEFKPTVKGLTVAKQLRETQTGAGLYKFLLDLCLGTVAAIPELCSESEPSANSTLDKVLTADLTYQVAIKRSSSSLFIEETPGEVTPTVRGLLEIESHLRGRTLVNNRDVLGAYQRLLKKRTA